MQKSTSRRLKDGSSCIEVGGHRAKLRLRGSVSVVIIIHVMKRRFRDFASPSITLKHERVTSAQGTASDAARSAEIHTSVVVQAVFGL